MKIYRSIVFILSLLVSSYAYCQPIFGQEIFDKMLTNPSFTAVDSTEDKVINTYQKYVVNEPMLLYLLASYQALLPNGKSAIGVMVNYNKYEQNTFPIIPQTEVFSIYWQDAAKLYYRYSPLANLSIGADAGLINYKTFYISDPGQLRYTSPYWLYPDIGVGVSYNYKKIAYLGFSLENINEPQYKYYYYFINSPDFLNVDVPNYQGIKYNLTAGCNVPISKIFSIDLLTWYNTSYTHISDTWTSNLLFSTVFHFGPFFLGISIILGNYPLDGDATMNYSWTLPNYCFFAGSRLLRNKLEISFGYDAYTNYLRSMPFLANATENIEGMLSYKF